LRRSVTGTARAIIGFMGTSIRLHRDSFQDHLAVEEVSTVKPEFLDGEIVRVRDRCGCTLRRSPRTVIGMARLMRSWVLLLALGLATLGAAGPASQAPDGWRSLFDGESLGAWKPTVFGGEGEVEVEDGRIMLGMGNDLTGITWTGEVPAVDYEIELQAMRVAGNDFFCGLTFPVGDSHCSFIVGGWAGVLVGLSSLDGMDASENETSRMMKFERNRWYTIRVRVTGSAIQAWIDEEQVVDVETAGRRIGIRPEVSASRPLGIASWRTRAALRHIRIRTLEVRDNQAEAWSHRRQPG
jgi:hypothetical protein